MQNATYVEQAIEFDDLMKLKIPDSLLITNEDSAMYANFLYIQNKLHTSKIVMPPLPAGLQYFNCSK